MSTTTITVEAKTHRRCFSGPWALTGPPWLPCAHVRCRGSASVVRMTPNRSSVNRLVRLLSITESFASELLLREVDKVTARARSAAVDSLWDEAAVRGTNCWKEQQTSYRDWLGVTEDWTAVDRLAEARKRGRPWTWNAHAATAPQRGQCSRQAQESRHPADRNTDCSLRPCFGFRGVGLP
jgi:hypothetical protein